MTRWLTLAFLSLSALLGTSVKAEDAPLFKAKFDYRQSFKKPFFFHANNHTIPHFTIGGDTFLSPSHVRLTASVPGSESVIWADKPNPHDEWEVHFALRITGGPQSEGGVAFWYGNRPYSHGWFYGVSYSIHGFGVILDSGDHKKGRTEPIVYGFQANGDVTNEWDTVEKHNQGKCFRSYRNTDHPVWFRVTYYNNEVHVYVDLTQSGQSYTECFAMKGVILPKGSYFGFSAMAGHETYGLPSFCFYLCDTCL